MNGSRLNPRQLIVLRIIWGALVFGQVMFLGLIVAGVVPQQHQVQPVLGYLTLGMLVTVVPITFIIRKVLLGRGEYFPKAAMTANVVFWAGCDGVCSAAMTFSVVSSWNWAFIVCVSIALGLQLLTFPR